MILGLGGSKLSPDAPETGYAEIDGSVWGLNGLGILYIHIPIYGSLLVSCKYLQLSLRFFTICLHR